MRLLEIPHLVEASEIDIYSTDDSSYNKVTAKGTAASRVFFHLKAEAVRMGE
jgi:hypothetical protein